MTRLPVPIAPGVRLRLCAVRAVRRLSEVDPMKLTRVQVPVAAAVFAVMAAAFLLVSAAAAHGQALEGCAGYDSTDGANRRLTYGWTLSFENVGLTVEVLAAGPSGPVQGTGAVQRDGRVEVPISGVDAGTYELQTVTLGPDQRPIEPVAGQSPFEVAASGSADCGITTLQSDPATPPEPEPEPSPDQPPAPPPDPSPGASPQPSSEEPAPSPTGTSTETTTPGATTTIAGEPSPSPTVDEAAVEEVVAAGDDDSDNSWLWIPLVGGGVILLGGGVAILIRSRAVG